MFVDPAHQRDVLERTMKWFDTHLKRLKAAAFSKIGCRVWNPLSTG
jgi:hypothetical protein